MFIIITMNKFNLQKIMKEDLDMYDEKESKLCKNVNPEPFEDLAEADMLFCDKTGTLTKN